MRKKKFQAIKEYHSISSVKRGERILFIILQATQGIKVRLSKGPIYLTNKKNPKRQETKTMITLTETQ